MTRQPPKHTQRGKYDSNVEDLHFRFNDDDDDVDVDWYDDNDAAAAAAADDDNDDDDDDDYDDNDDDDDDVDDEEEEEASTANFDNIISLSIMYPGSLRTFDRNFHIFVAKFTYFFVYGFMKALLMQPTIESIYTLCLQERV